MRTSSLLLSASIGPLVTLGFATGIAWADPIPADPGTAPSHYGSGGTNGGNATTGTRTDGGVVVVDENQPAGAPWGWITTGVLVVLGGGAGSAYLLSRRGRSAEEHAGSSAAKDDSLQPPNDRLSV